MNLRKKTIAVLLAVWTLLISQGYFMVNADNVPANGYGYAVFVSEGNLVFFRSKETYSDKSEGTFKDINGNTFSGTIYSGVEYTETIPWAEKRNSIKKVYVASGNEIRPQTTMWWFGNCVSLTSFDATGFNTADVRNMSHMFYNCKSIKQLNLSGLNTGNARVMSHMFEDCSALTSLNVSGFDTSKVYDMVEMFKNCKNLKTLNISSFITSNVISMAGMFNGCNSLSSIDLSKFTTSNVEDMSEMFKNCHSLTSLKVNAFNTAEVKNMSSMFTNCSAITSLNLSNFNTSSVTDMDAMFYGCKALSDLNVSSFNTTNVITMDGIFANCRSLKTLAINHFVTSKLENMAFAFYGCSALEELHIAGFNTSKVADMSGRFTGCDSLTRVEISEKFSKWSDEAYLPEGNWKNGRLIKSEKELYMNYTSNLQEWAGTWDKTSKNDYIKRAFGSNRYKTSLAVTDLFMETYNISKLENIIIADGRTFADALTGSYLAAKKIAPIIIVNDTNLSMITTYLKDKMASDGTIYILGGPAAVSTSIENELKKIAKTKRLEGSNRYFTNLEIIKEAGMDSDVILVGTGFNYADSLSASATGLPIMLVKDSLTVEQRVFLGENKGKKIYVLGGANAVSTKVEIQLKEYGTVVRLEGANRVATSIKIAETFFPGSTVAVLAYSHDFPDGLCGGALAYRLNGPVLLTRGENKSTTEKYIESSPLSSAVVTGGLAKLDDALVKDIMNVSDNYVIRYYYR